jgi:fatty-acyl-CoA synthase
MLHGLMMDTQLTIGSVFEHFALNHPEQEIVSYSSDGIHRYPVIDFAKRVRKLANALTALGIKPGDRVASFAWNGYRHLELYYAVPIVGAVLHTVNIRLFPAQVSYVLNHAEDKLVFFDASLTALVEKAVEADEEKEKQPRGYVSFEKIESKLTPLYDYEQLLDEAHSEYVSTVSDERQAAMLCYTSATTGEPKGVLYSHRSIVLHALTTCLPDAMGLSSNDVMLPVVPMFHACSWGYPYAIGMTGSRLVLNGDIMDGPGLIKIIDAEKVTVSAAVPTVWMRIRDELHKTKDRLKYLQRGLVGGSALSESLLKDMDNLGIETMQGYGMTETSPCVSISRRHLKGSLENASPELKLATRLKQGRFFYGVKWRAIDDDGKPIKQDGQAMGELQYQGPWVTSGYYNNKAANEFSFSEDGWFRTGDVCSIDEYGYVQLVDRKKDIIKSGGEWISSVDLENAIAGHEAVKEAAVIAVPHPDWVERPVAVVTLRDGKTATEESIKSWLSERVAKWWVPDRIMFIDVMPLTGVGKFLKRDLRERFKDVLSEKRVEADAVKSVE